MIPVTSMMKISNDLKTTWMNIDINARIYSILKSRLHFVKFLSSSSQPLCVELLPSIDLSTKFRRNRGETRENWFSHLARLNFTLNYTDLNHWYCSSSHFRPHESSFRSPINETKIFISPR